MTPTQLTLLAFFSGAMLIFATGMLLRSLILAGAGGVATTSSGRLRRLPAVADDSSARDLGAKIDQGFNRLVLESGTQIVPMSAFLLCVTTALALGGFGWFYTLEPAIALGGAVTGMLVPLAVLAVRRSWRIAEIRKELPHVLDMMARATRAGQSTEQAIELVAAEAGGLLGPEFAHCARQLSMGRSFDRVMKSLAHRVRLVEIRILSTTLIVQKQAGGRLSETLDRMSQVVRDRLMSQRQIKAATGAGRASTLVVSVISPIAYAFVFLFHRSHLQIMFDSPTGRTLLIAALAMEIIGLIWVAALLRTES